MADEILITGKALLDQVQKELRETKEIVEDLSKQGYEIDLDVDLDQIQRSLSKIKGDFTKISNELKINPEVDFTKFDRTIGRALVKLNEFSSNLKKSFERAFTIDTGELEEIPKELEKVVSVGKRLEEVFNQLREAALRYMQISNQQEADKLQEELEQTKRKIIELSTEFLKNSDNAQKYGKDLEKAFNSLNTQLSKLGKLKFSEDFEGELKETQKSLEKTADVADKATDDIKKSLEKAGKAADELEEKFDRSIADGFEKSKKSIAQDADAIARSLEKAERAYIKSGEALKKIDDKELKQLRIEQEKAAQALYKFSKAQNVTAADVQRARTVYAQAAQTLHNVTTSQNATAASIAKARQAYNQAGSNLQYLINQQKATANSANSLVSAFSSLNIASKAYLASLVVAKIQQFGRAIAHLAEEAAKAEAVMVQFNSIMQKFGSGAAEEQFAKLDAITSKLGTSLRATVTEFNKIVGAAKSAGLSLDQTTRIFESVSAGATVLGLSADKIEGTFNAINQTFSKGILQSEELRKQLGNNLPDAFNLMAKGLGVAADVLEERMRAGLVGSKEAALALAIALEETYGDKIDAASKRAEASLQRIENAQFKAFAQIGEKIAPALADLANSIEAAFGNKAVVDDFGAAIGKTIEITSKAVDVLNDYAGAFSLLKSAIEAANIGTDGAFLRFLNIADKSDFPGIKFLAESIKNIGFNTKVLAIDLADNLEKIAKGFELQGQTEKADKLRVIIEKISQIKPVEVLKQDSLDTSEKRLEKLRKDMEEIRKVGEKPIDLFGDTIDDVNKELGDILVKFRAIELSSKDFASDFAQEAVEEFFKLKEEMQEVINASPELKKIFEDAERYIPQVAREAYEAAKAAKELADQMKLVGADPTGIKESIEALQEYVRQIEESGAVTEDQAKNIGSKFEEIQKKINLLTPEQKKAFDEYKKFLDEVKEKYEKFGKEAERAASKAEKAVVKSAKEQQKSFDNLGKTLAGVYKQLVQIANETDKQKAIDVKTNVEETTKNVEELKRQIREIESKPIIDAGDSSRLDELKDQLFDAERAAKDASDAFTQPLKDLLAETEDTGEKFNNVIESLITGNQKFQDSFNRLSPDAQRAVQEIIERYAHLADQGQITKESIDNMFQSLNSIFEAAGADRLTQQFDQTKNSVDNITAAFDALKQKNQEVVDAVNNTDIAAPVQKAAEETSQAVKVFEEDGKKIVTNLQEIVETSEGLTVKYKEEIVKIGDEWTNIRTKVEEESEGVSDATENVAESAKQTAQEVASGANEISQAIQDFKTKAESFPQSTQVIVDAITLLNSLDFEALAEKLNAVSAPFDAISQAAQVLAENKDAFIEAITGFFTAIEENSESEAFAKFQESLEGIIEPLNAIAETLDNVSDSFSDMQESIPATSEALVSFKDAATEITDSGSLDKFADQLGNVEEKATAAKAPTAEISSTFDKIKTTLEELNNKLSDFVGKLNDSTLAIRDNQGEYETLLSLLDENKTKAGELNAELLRLSSEGVPAVNALKASVDQLTASMKQATAAANELANAVSSVPPLS